MSSFEVLDQPMDSLEAVCLAAGIKALINLLGPHDAWKHHFTSLKIDLIFLQPWVL